MSKHNEIGIKGEQIAIQFLEKRGYTIVNTNWRTGNKEIDIIATYRDIWVFIEVKTRTGTTFIYPEEAISNAKIKNLKSAAVTYLNDLPASACYRFDVVGVVLDKKGSVVDLKHFEEAFI